MNEENTIQRIWNLCHILRGDGISYHEYISELTYLLFLKIAEENRTEDLLPNGYRWKDLAEYEGDDLLTFYRDMLTYLGGHATRDEVKKIYAFPTTVFSHSANLKAVIDGISKIDWHSLTYDHMGDIYEGLLAKNSQDARSGAGQYFTPRALVDSIVRIIQPSTGEVIQDPSVGSGGFLISADQHIRKNHSPTEYEANPPSYEGVEIEKGTYRICLMNAFLHRLQSKLILGDALTDDAHGLQPADVILANPPFGAKAGSMRKKRADIKFPTANKQLAFLQHIYLGLKPGGRAAVVLPDNVLFEEGVGRKIRADLMDRCVLHTILRLPTGIFYSHGVKTNVLFFYKSNLKTEKTTGVWIYDMRAGAARFGKNRQLQCADFSDFESEFGNNKYGQSPREDRGINGRWRRYTREEISSRGDDLNIQWLRDSEDGSSEADVPLETIAAEITGYLEAALAEMRSIVDDLEGPELAEAGHE